MRTEVDNLGYNRRRPSSVGLAPQFPAPFGSSGYPLVFNGFLIWWALELGSANLANLAPVS